jgi:pSer/pThr/pTyr-binding forkhead associated (FHA) protein
VSRLVIFEGEEQRAEHELARAVVGLGRHPQNDIVLNDRTLSRFHARIERRDDHFVVIALAATNGVHVNGARIEGEAPLQNGDRIELGRYTAVFHAPRAGQKKAPATGPVGMVRTNAPVPDLDLDLDIDVGGGIDLDMTVEPSQVDHVAPRPTLVLLFNNVEVSRHPVHSEGLTIGRSKQCDVVISLLGLSRKHTRVSVVEDGVAVEDLGSQNGTWVNNERVEGLQVLQHGDMLNFYDYNVLFLEDGDVDVGLPGVADAPGDDGDDLFPSDAKAAPKAAARASANAVNHEEDETALGRPRRSGRHRTDDGLNLDDLGDGSFLGDEFDEGASKARPNSREARRSAAPASAPASTPARKPKGAADRTGLYEPDLQLSRSGGDEDLEAEVAFSAAAVATNGSNETGDRTSVGLELQGAGGEWPTDDELEGAMMIIESSSVTLEITRRGKPYTQVPLNLPVMRLGSDPRCEISLPRSSGLRPWHVTFAQVGASLLAVRSNQAALLEVDGREVASALVANGQTLTVGKVSLLVRARR